MEARSHNLGAWALLLVLIAGSFLILFSLGDHPFYGRSDVRYAEVSREMLEQGEWLVPQKRGKAHLTKPPLVYWLEAGAMKLLGPNELAARLPSALAGSATLAIAAALAWKRYGREVAILAAGMLAIMPLHVVVSRLPLTDGPLGLFWFCALACGLLAAEEPQRRRWPILLWTAVALGLLSKGPQALIPVALLLAWLAFSRRWQAIRALRLGWGLPLAALPLCAWTIAILATYSGAYRIWISDLFARGELTPLHAEPWWYYLPLILCGLFPATLAMRIPLLSISGRDTLARFRAGDDKALWLLAIVLPLVGFSLRTGKLVTYMMPLCAPAAILGSLTLKRWLDGEYKGVLPRWAMQPWTVLMLIMLGGLGLGIALESAGPKLVAKYAERTQGDGQAILAAFRATWVLVALCAIAAAAACVQWWVLRRETAQQTARGWVLAIVWASLLVLGLGLSEAEDRVLGLMRIREVAAEARQISAEARAPIVVFGTSGLSLNFYLQQESRDVTVAELRQVVAEDGPLCIVADKEALDHKLKGPNAQLLAGFQRTPVLNPVPYDKPLCILWRSAKSASGPDSAQLHANR